MTLTIRLLGPPAIERDGRPAPPPRGRKAWALLAFLLLTDQPDDPVPLLALGGELLEVARNPMEEANHELLVRSLAAAGDRAAALRQVAVGADILCRELGAVADAAACGDPALQGQALVALGGPWSTRRGAATRRARSPSTRRSSWRPGPATGPRRSPLSGSWGSRHARLRHGRLPHRLPVPGGVGRAGPGLRRPAPTGLVAVDPGPGPSAARRAQPGRGRPRRVAGFEHAWSLACRLGDPAALASARLLAAGIDNPALTPLLDGARSGA